MNNIHDFINKVENFSILQPSEMIDFFAYYLLVIEKQESFKVKDISNCFDLLKIPPYSNISKYLSDNSKKSKNKTQKFIKKPDSYYCLSKQRGEELSQNVVLDLHKVEVSNILRDLLKKLTKQSEIDFLKEAIKTFEVEAYRASILMVWLLTLDHLYEYILANKIQEFIAALRRANNQKSINSKDDFGDIKESIFIEVCRSAEIISNDIRKILVNKLDIRNSFAHPSTIHLPKSKALEFIEDLVINVILKY